jgi:hypothetical protein
LHDAGDQPYQLAAGDFDGDGLPDLVVAASDQGLTQFTRVRVLMNNGAGFDAPMALGSMVTGGDFSPHVTAGDIDLDGDIDIVYGDLKVHVGGLNSLYASVIYRNQGDGTFSEPEPQPLGAYTGAFASTAIGDVTGDGWPDIVGAHEPNKGWSIIPSDGAGGFEPYTEYIAAEYPADLMPADADGDGDLEILIAGRFSMEVTVHYGRGAGDFSPPPMYPVIGGSYHFDAADIDLDGDLDIAASRGYASNGAISVLENLGDGSFAGFVEYPAPVYASSVKLRDLNGDAYPDLLWADKYPPYSWRSKLNNGDGTFGATQSWLQTFTCGISLNNDAIGAFDLDNDGDLDVVLLENLGCGVDPQQLFIHENDGAGNFTLVNIIDMPWPPMEVMATDTDGDGLLDLIVGGRTITVLLGNGNLTFQPPDVQGLTEVPATDATLADLNGDGIMDVAVGIPWNSNVYPALGVMLGNGDGTFDGPVLYDASFSPNLTMITSITTGDPDGDGDVDVMLGNYAANDLSYFENNGDATFRPQYHIGAGNSTRDVHYADFTGDGAGDIAAMVSTAEGLYVVAMVAGRETGTPEVTGDLDGDGAVGPMDLAILLGNWGACPQEGDCPADLNGDGAVDATDLAILLGNWG